MQPLLEIQNLSVSIKKHSILNNINLKLQNGKITGLIGGSGSGKTTLIKVLLDIPISNRIQIKGNILLNGKALDAKNRKQIQPVFQDPSHFFNPHWTLIECLDEPLILQNEIEKENRLDKIKLLLSEFSISINALNQKIGNFSGGELQRISIIRAILCNPQILLMDEPVSGLDPLIQRDAIELIKTLNKEKKISILLISHDIDFISELCDYIYVISEGSIVEANSCSIVINSPCHEYTKLLLNSRKLEDIKV